MVEKSLHAEAESLLDKLDMAAWTDVQRIYEGEFARFGDQRPDTKDDRCALNYAKYFDLNKFIRYHLRLVRLLGLDVSKSRKRVMDIGCGAGIFLYICKTYGHDVLGIEVASAMYADMAKALGVDLRASPVVAFERQPKEITGFDWITAIAIKFDRLDWGPQSAEPWKLEEWQFFIEDMATRLNAGGHMLIKPNYMVKPSDDAPGHFFADDRIVPYLEKVAVRRTETEFILSKELIL